MLYNQEYMLVINIYTFEERQAEYRNTIKPNVWTVIRNVILYYYFDCIKI